MFAAAGYLSRDPVGASDDMIPGVIQDGRSSKKPIQLQSKIILQVSSEILPYLDNQIDHEQRIAAVGYIAERHELISGRVGQ